MFDLVVGGISAFNQVCVLIGALTCAGLGGLLVGNAIYWRMHALRVQGQLIGVRQNANVFNAVYRYTLPSGETYEATSLEGSSDVSNKQSGARVPLLVIPNKPDQVQEARNHVFTIVGVVLLAVCVGLFYFAVTAWRVGPMTWLVGSLVLAHFATRIMSIVFPKDKSLRPSGLKEFLRSSTSMHLATAPVQRLEDSPLLADRAAQQTQQRARVRRLAPLLLLAGIGLLALGVQQSRMLVRLEAAGVRTRGVVSSLSSSRDNDGGVVYYPVVTYMDQMGHTTRFRDSSGSNPPGYHVNDAVTVLYSPIAAKSAIIDRGIWNWLPAIILYLFGILLSLLSIALLRRRSDQVGAAFPTQNLQTE